MSLLKSLGDMANSITQATLEKGREISEISKLNAETRKNEDLIRKLKLIIAEYVIDNKLLTDVEVVLGTIDRIKEAQEVIESNKIKAEEIRASVNDKFDEVNRATSEVGAVFTETAKDLGEKATKAFNKATQKAADMTETQEDIDEDIDDDLEENFKFDDFEDEDFVDEDKTKDKEIKSELNGLLKSLGDEIVKFAKQTEDFVNKASNISKEDFDNKVKEFNKKTNEVVSNLEKVINSKTKGAKEEFSDKSKEFTQKVDEATDEIEHSVSKNTAEFAQKAGEVVKEMGKAFSKLSSALSESIKDILDKEDITEDITKEKETPKDDNATESSDTPKEEKTEGVEKDV
jgi:hypothetical protein